MATIPKVSAIFQKRCLSAAALTDEQLKLAKSLAETNFGKKLQDSDALVIAIAQIIATNYLAEAHRTKRD